MRTYISIGAILLIALNAVITIYGKGLQLLFVVNLLAILIFLYWLWILDYLMSKETAKIIYTFNKNGLKYEIYDRVPGWGELCCTWHHGKKHQLETNPVFNLSVFPFDEQCAMAEEIYDFRFIKITVI